MNTILSAIASARSAFGSDFAGFATAPEKRRLAGVREFAKRAAISREQHKALAASYRALADNAAAVLNSPTPSSDFDRLVAMNSRAYHLAQLHEAASRSKACAA